MKPDDILKFLRIDLLFVQLAVMLLPGLIWAEIVVTYAMKERPRAVEFLIRAFIFGVLTYLAVYSAYTTLGKEFSFPQVGEPYLLHVDFVDEILWSSVAALIFSIAWVYGSTYRLMTRFLNWSKATTTHGRRDIWDLTFSRSDERVKYVHVRDFEKGIIYAGWVGGYSETGKLRELLLVDVRVWDNSGKSTDVPMLYLSRQDSDLHVEFPHTPEEDKHHAKAQKSGKTD